MGIKKTRIGKAGKNTDGDNMSIIEYTNRDNIVIQFDNGYKAKTRYQAFKNGNVKNVYFKSVCGVGFIGEGEYNSIKNKRSYKVWKDMIRRCYSDDINYKRSYKDCSVCEGWHNFQAFTKWYEENYYEVEGDVVCLDKDILIKGNKIYSPDTCIFVPQRINSLFTKNTCTSKERVENLINTYVGIPLDIQNKLKKAIKILN